MINHNRLWQFDVYTTYCCLRSWFIVKTITSVNRHDKNRNHSLREPQIHFRNHRRGTVGGQHSSSYRKRQIWIQPDATIRLARQAIAVHDQQHTYVLLPNHAGLHMDVGTLASTVIWMSTSHWHINNPQRNLRVPSRITENIYISWFLYMWLCCTSGQFQMAQCRPCNTPTYVVFHYGLSFAIRSFQRHSHDVSWQPR